MTGRTHDIAEPVLAYGAPGVHHHSVADQAIGDRSIGADRTVSPDAHLGSDCGAGVDHRTGPDLRTRPDDDTGIYRHATFQARARMHKGACRYTARFKQGGW